MHLKVGFSAGKTIIRKAETFLWERRLRISTRGPSYKCENQEHMRYTTVPYGVIFQVLRRLELVPSDVFVDLGCGRGRVCCCAARFALSAVVGVEDVGELAQSARFNLRHMRGAHTERREVLCGKAQEYDYSSATVVYMFHPFGPNVMKDVVNRIKRSLDIAPRDLRIAYVNPIHESLLAHAGWLRRYDYWGPESLPEHKRAVSFWTASGYSCQ